MKRNGRLAMPSLVTDASRDGVRHDFSYQVKKEDDTGKEADMALTREVGQVLTKMYPDHLWAVLASHQQGIIEIKLPCFSSFSYVIHIKNVQSPNALWAAVKKAGGEWLEIYQQPRARFDSAAYSDTMRQLGPAPEMNPLKVNVN